MPCMRADRGAALVLVLWLVALLAALVGTFALSARVEALQGRVLGESALLQERARAGLEYGLFRLRGSPLRPGWRPDGRRYRWQFEGATVDIRIVDESGKVDLNVADAGLLTALMRALGVEQERAQRLAGAIVDWRDPDDLTQPGGGAEDADYAAAGLPYGAKDANFESLGELRTVLGMDAALYRQLLPNVSIYGHRSRPDRSFAPGPVLTALGLDATTLLAQREGAGLLQADGTPAAIVGSGTGTYSVECRAWMAGGREAVLHAVVRTGPSALPGAAYTVLRWEEGATDR
jgi:general secretion pathway protein K